MKLNKCPFCGNDAKIIGRKKIKVVCTKCGAQSPPFDFKSEAEEYWNTRTSMETEYINKCNKI